MRAYAALALIAAALLGGAFMWGGHVTDNAWQAKQAKADRAQAARYQAEVQRADTAAAAYLTEHLQQETRYEALDDHYKTLRQRLPITVPARVTAGAALGGAAAAPADPGAAAPGRIELPAAVGAPHLALGAVWMWNSALAGRDVAAGACNPASATGAAEAACAEDSGLDVDDAWANHVANARSCARDRQRFEHLIEFLKGRTQ